VICNAVFVAPRIVSQVGLVVPVELQGIRRRHGGTSAWDRWNRRCPASCCREKSYCVVPPVPPAGTTEINKTACSTTGSTRSPASATIPPQE
jgi:hypothetical protein